MLTYTKSELNKVRITVLTNQLKSTPSNFYKNYDEKTNEVLRQLSKANYVRIDGRMQRRSDFVSGLKTDNDYLRRFPKSSTGPLRNLSSSSFANCEISEIPISRSDVLKSGIKSVAENSKVLPMNFRQMDYGQRTFTRLSGQSSTYSGKSNNRRRVSCFSVFSANSSTTSSTPLTPESDSANFFPSIITSDSPKYNKRHKTRKENTKNNKLGFTKENFASSASSWRRTDVARLKAEQGIELANVCHNFDSDDSLSLKTASEGSDFVFVDAIDNSDFCIEFNDGKNVRKPSFFDVYVYYFKLINEGITKMFNKV